MRIPAGFRVKSQFRQKACSPSCWQLESSMPGRWLRMRKSPSILREPDMSGRPVAHSLPPRVDVAQRFRAQRGWNSTVAAAANRFETQQQTLHFNLPQAVSSGSSSASVPTWQPLGPANVVTPDFGAVTGRVTALALDPSEATGTGFTWEQPVVESGLRRMRERRTRRRLYLLRSRMPLEP